MKQNHFLLAFVVFLCIGFGNDAVTAQNLRSSVFGKTPFVEPLRISGINYKRNVPQKNGNRTWLSDLSVEVENTSGKTIALAEVKVEFIGAKVPSRSAFIMLRHGKLDFNSSTSANFEPGAKVLMIPGNECTGTQDALLKSGYVPTSDKEIRVEFGKVIFEDGTAWSAGASLIRDPKDSNRWVVDKPASGRRELNENLFDVSGEMIFMPASYTIAAPQKCGTYIGFEEIPGCCPDYPVFTDVVDETQPGNAKLVPMGPDRCPYTPEVLSCVWYNVTYCH